MFGRRCVRTEIPLGVTSRMKRQCFDSALLICFPKLEPSSGYHGRPQLWVAVKQEEEGLGFVSALSNGIRPSMQAFRDLGTMLKMPLITDRSGGGGVSPCVNIGLRQSSRRKPHVSFLAFSVGL